MTAAPKPPPDKETSMIRPSLRRIAVLALCAVLAGSGALYGKPRDTTGSSGFAAVSKGAPVVSWATLWRFLVNLWPKNGPAGDPNGNPSSPQPDGDNGGAGDPFGAGTKNGSSPDPNGNPSSTQGSQPDGNNGSGIDPYGG
jgi:hypothetical protein